MNQVYGRGRGSLMAKMLDSQITKANTESNERGHTSLGRGLMTPSQFIKSKPASKTKQENEDEVQSEGTSKISDELLSDEKIITKTETLESAELEQFASEEATPCITSSAAVCDSLHLTANECTVADNKTEQAEQEWKIYQCERKINKILKEVNDENLSVVFDELENFVEECPLSSRYTNCSEVKQLIEVLIQKAVQKEEFLPFAPCLMKMVSDHSEIAFKKHFKDIADAKCQEYVTLCASDELLSMCGQRFCKFLGHMLTTPRQTSKSFYDIIAYTTEEYVERWTYPDGTQANLDGSKKHLAAAYAVAAKVLLVEIATKMIACDREVEKRMEKFVWYVRESNLNNNLPRKVREIYLDALIDIQTCGSSVPSNKANQISNMELVSGDEQNFIRAIEADDLKEDENDVEIEEEIDTKDTLHKNESPTTVTDFSKEKQIAFKRDLLEDLSYLDDPYLCVTHLLKDLELEEYIPKFKEKEIQDSSLNSPALRSMIEESGCEKFVSFQIHMAFSNLGIEKLRRQAIDAAKQDKQDRTPHKLEQVFATDDVVSEDASDKNKLLDDLKDEHHSLNYHASSRMAINFQTKRKSSETSKEKKSSLEDIETTTQVKCDENFEDSEPDIIIEDQYEIFDDDSSLGNDSDQFSLFIAGGDSTPPQQVQSHLQNQSSEHLKQQLSHTTSPGKLPVGRGRGMVKFSVLEDNDPKRYGRNSNDGRTPRLGKHSKTLDGYNKKNGRAYSNKYNRENFAEKNSNWRNKPRHEYRQNNSSRENRPRFQAVNHSKKSFKGEEEKEVASVRTFGMVRPNICLRCSAKDHLSDNCPVKNPFF